MRNPSGLSPEQLTTVREFLLELCAQSPGSQKSNRGGWHSDGNLFATEASCLVPVREAVTRAIFAYIGEAFAYQGPIQLALNAWTVINGPGDYNVPHNHAANLLSGAFYISIPEGMNGGAIVFQDPRLNLNAHETEAMRVLGVRPPWMATSISVIPEQGDILIFPSWLVHWVEPYQAADPGAVRIVISFNSSITT